MNTETMGGCVTGSLQASAAQPDTREMDRIEHLADRLSMVRDCVTGFLSRFHGYVPTPLDQKANVAPVPTGYRGQLDRAYEMLNELESLTSDLVALG